MSPAPAEHVVAFLSFSGSRDVGTLQTLGPRRWRHLLQWLDDSGLAFYFLTQLKEKGVANQIPADVLRSLEEKYTANQQRVESMSERFHFLNQHFDDAGVTYSVLKGLSLVPQFCPSAPLRYQGDFDYLVDPASLSKAHSVLTEAGYVPKESRSAEEFIYVTEGKASRGADQYSHQAPHAVELHLDIWDGQLHGLPPLPGVISLNRVTAPAWNGTTFPALSDEDAFLLQILHATHHLFTHWVRMSCLLEISYFLQRRGSDSALWEAVERRVGSNDMLREFVVVIAELASRLFGSPLPPLLQSWASAIRPGVRVWTDDYARTWAFSAVPVYQFSMWPASKLSSFLHAQYRQAALAAKNTTSRDVISISKKRTGLLPGRPRWWRRRMLLRRILFHVLAGTRYACEIPRWRWRNAMRPTRVRAGQSMMEPSPVYRAAGISEREKAL
jgi:hypothetical protein